MCYTHFPIITGGACTNGSSLLQADVFQPQHLSWFWQTANAQCRATCPRLVSSKHHLELCNQPLGNIPTGMEPNVSRGRDSGVERDRVTAEQLEWVLNGGLFWYNLRRVNCSQDSFLHCAAIGIYIWLEKRQCYINSWNWLHWNTVLTQCNVTLIPMWSFAHTVGKHFTQVTSGV